MGVDDEADSDTTAGSARPVLGPSYPQNPPLSSSQQGDFPMFEGANISIAMSDIFVCPPSLDSALPQGAAGRVSSMSPASTLASGRSPSSSSNSSSAPHQQQPRRQERQSGPSVVDDVFAPLLEKINLGSIRPLHFNEDESDMVDTRSNAESTPSWLAGASAQSSKPGGSFNDHADSMVMRNQRPKYPPVSQTSKKAKT
ncbi:hypothetical protein EC988_003724 [Linderina pennispora]|nr:hypothetical protein EC988_003724 [Linderina pennispora]